VAAPGQADAGPAGPSPEDLPHLRRCVELAAEALGAGDFPFGSVLVTGDGQVLAEDRNRENSLGDATRHPEFELARWAAANLTAEQRAAATVFTSGEHCPMCSAAHAWVGLGRIVYVSSSEQLIAWLAEFGLPPSPVTPLAINQVAPGLVVQGPVPGLDEEVRELQRRFRVHLDQAHRVAAADAAWPEHLGVDAGARFRVDRVERLDPVVASQDPQRFGIAGQ
jgi:tRNA(Arg) A34 adenosine deaminase TadA